jgi:acyl-CoA thioester hydrolase
MPENVSSIEQRVRPRHCDAQGMVYAPRYHEFCEDALVTWLEEQDKPYAGLRASGVDLVITEARYSYHRPARLDDRLTIAVDASPVGDSAFQARFSVDRGDDHIADAAITYVAVRGGKRCPLPEPLRKVAG